MISRKLEVMIEAADPYLIHSRGTAITAFFPYVVWRESSGRYEALDMFLCAARASKGYRFMQPWVEPFVAELFNEECSISIKRAAILASPHMPWVYFTYGECLVQLWAAAAWAIPCTDEIGQIVANTLLQIAACNYLLPRIPSGVWLWVDKRPSLPPDCRERRGGSAQDVVRTVRALGSAGTLTPYLLLVWSEWDYIFDLEETYASIREGLGGIWMGQHREDLLQHLDNILGQLDLGLEHLQRHKPDLEEGDIQRMKAEYGKIKEVLLGVDEEATDRLIREDSGSAILFCLLTPADRCRIPLDVHVCDPSPMSVVAGST